MRRKRSANRKPGVLGHALAPSSSLHAHVCPGLQALENADRKRVVAVPASIVADSLALDQSLEEAEPNAHRWDYLLGTNDKRQSIVGVEVHPAIPREVKEVVKKKQRAEEAVKAHFDKGRRVRAWFWIASGSTRIPPTTAESKRLAKAGITLVGQSLRLPRPGDD